MMSLLYLFDLYVPGLLIYMTLHEKDFMKLCTENLKKN